MNLRSILTVLCATLGTAIYSFTWNSVTVALPHMQGAFSATTDQITWVMIAFVIGSAMTTAAVGWFSARFGRKRVFLGAIAGYTATLVGCGLAATLEEAVAWRFLQGTFGAALIPVGQAIAVNAFPKDRHGQATSLWALGFVSANVVAPTAVDTAFIRGGTGRGGDDSNESHIDVEAYEKTVPLGRIAVPDDVVGPILFLLGDASRYMTGQVLHISGGAIAP